MDREDPLSGEVSIQAHLDESGLAVSTKSRAVAAFDRLLGGLVDIPGAYVESISRRRRAKDEAQEQLDRAIASARIEGATELERLRQRALLHDEQQKLRRQINREDVVGLVVEDLRENPPADDQPGSLDEDWLNKMVRLTEDASTERLKLLYAKILSGEIKRPGSFSPTTLRLASELTQSLAEEFSWACEKSIGLALWKGPAFDSGEPWTKLRKLRDAGLLSPIDSAIHQPPFSPVNVPDLEIANASLWQIGPMGSIFLWVAMTGQFNTRLNVINFTEAGLELSNILPSPDYEANLRELAVGFPKQGVAWIKLINGSQRDTLWSL